jgi:hypothetical protein
MILRKKATKNKKEYHSKSNMCKGRQGQNDENRFILFKSSVIIVEEQEMKLI